MQTGIFSRSGETWRGTGDTHINRVYAIHTGITTIVLYTYIFFRFPQQLCKGPPSNNTTAYIYIYIYIYYTCFHVNYVHHYESTIQIQIRSSVFHVYYLNECALPTLVARSPRWLRKYVYLGCLSHRALTVIEFLEKILLCVVVNNAGKFFTNLWLR